MNQQQLENKINRLYAKLISPQTNRDELNAIGARMEREKDIDWRWGI